MSEDTNLPETPANLRPYVKALGVKGAMALFLSVGGSEIYLPKERSRRSLAARTIGPENADKLASEMGYGYYKVPLAREWVAKVMRAQGESNAEIARTIRVDIATVRRWLPAQELPKPALQLDMFKKTGS